MGVEYTKILDDTIAEYEDLRAKRDEIDIQIAKKYQFIRATLNLLPDAERKRYDARLFLGRQEEHGPTVAIKQILPNHPTRWMTATQVRDRLVATGFDFSHYKSNPLASVHSILNRLGREEEIESTM